MTLIAKYADLRRQLQLQVLLICAFFLMLVSLVTWTVVSRSQSALIEFEALKLAEIVADQASAARAVYASMAVSKLKDDGYGAHETSADRQGHIPLPAQFLSELSKRSNSAPEPVFSFRPVSRWNLARDQGIVDDFQQWAWQALEKQQTEKPAGPISWQPTWRIENSNGEQTLRYMRADPASSASCVNCHNAIEKRADIIAQRLEAGIEAGKQWKIHDLLGAIEISIPLDQAMMLARTQTRHGLLTVVGVVLIGLCGVVLLVFIDAARNKVMTSQLSHQAQHDSLTGLPNRLHFDMRVIALLEADEPFAVMLLDLDNFKQINDTLGHESGDIVLCESGVRIGQAIPEAGFLARLGGDEFAIAIPGTDQAGAECVARDIAAVIDQSYEIQSYCLTIGVSTGIAVYPDHGTELSELLRCADVAMYVAKNAGLSSSIYDSCHDNNHVSKLLLNNALREAIVDNRITVHYQPKYCLASGRMTGVEALARWVSEERGFIPPDVFIPMAESLGLVNHLAASVLEQSLKECHGWRQAGFNLTVSVNLSAFSLIDRGIVELISNTLQEVGIAADALIMEVTEGAVMSDPEQAINVLQEISDLGVRVSVDDYGTGYCSLSYLTTLPVSELKLDKSFVQKMSSHDKDAQVVKATVQLARSLNLTMVAEGVEDATTLDYLCDIGCDLVQGYFLCRPLSVSDLNRRLPYIYTFTPRASAVNNGMNRPMDKQHRRAA